MKWTFREQNKGVLTIYDKRKGSRSLRFLLLLALPSLSAFLYRLLWKRSGSRPLKRVTTVTLPLFLEQQMH